MDINRIIVLRGKSDTGKAMTLDLVIALLKVNGAIELHLKQAEELVKLV